MDMVEKVARALSIADGFHPEAVSNDGDDQPAWTLYVGMAKAAIEALRKPTPEMIAAGAWSNYGWTREQSIERGKEEVYDEYASNAASIYREMIDAALKEQEKVG